MELLRFFSTTGSLAAAAATLLVTLCSSSQAVRAEDKVQIGLRISPVPVKLAGKDRELVGLGSYLVNAVGSCNDCHSAGPVTQYRSGGNPFFGEHPTKVNPATFLGGGNDFGPLIPGSAHIVSRNLTPDKTGRAVGGDTFDEFLHVLRTGEDHDHAHPTCSGAINDKCVPRPFDGGTLQIMPWPVYQNMTDRDIRAIYEYLSAIPCVAGPPAPSPLHHNCR